MRKPSILTFVRYYLPGDKSGGPVQSIANMVNRLSDAFLFKVVTSDRDWLDAQPYPKKQFDRWARHGKAEVFYCSKARQSLGAFRRLIWESEHDLIYLNSFFDPVFTQKPLLLRRLGLLPKRQVLLAPRGEFSRGALALKAWKKSPYLSAARMLGIYQDIIWHGSTEYEAEEIRVAMGLPIEIRVAMDLSSNQFRYGSTVLVAPNLAAHCSPLDAERPAAKQPGKLRILFLSRITRKKNLDGALSILSKVKAHVRFDIYGVIDDPNYWQECQELIAKIPANVQVNCCGHVPHEQVTRVMADHDLFFLPTRGENFGHVIYEALSTGLPILISDATPWRHLEQSGAGWDIPLNSPERFVQVIESCASMSATEHAPHRASAWKLAATNDLVRKAVEKNRELFWSAMGKD